MALAPAFTWQENQTIKENILPDNSRNSLKGKKQRCTNSQFWLPEIVEIQNKYRKKKKKSDTPFL